jgi:hypothetical protein
MFRRSNWKRTISRRTVIFRSCQRCCSKSNKKLKKIYMLFFFGTLMTRRSEKKMTFFWTSEGGNSFSEYFLNKPGNLFSNFDILLGRSQITIYMKFKKIHILVVFLPIVSFSTLNNLITFMEHLYLNYIATITKTFI